MNHRIEVSCRPEPQRWVCTVMVGDDPAATHHEVTVSRDLLARLRTGADEPDTLVRHSLAFLLEREPRESILRSFDLPVIGHYFPEWEADVLKRVARS